jgi:hypothetical protein
MNADGKIERSFQSPTLAQHRPGLRKAALRAAQNTVLATPAWNSERGPISGTAAGQASRTLGVARPAAELEPPAAADEAQGAAPLAADGALRPPLARGREPPAGLGEAQWAQPPSAEPAREPPEATDEGRPAKPARERPEAPESPSTAPRLPVSRRHSVSAVEGLRVLAPAVSARR